MPVVGNYILIPRMSAAHALDNGTTEALLRDELAAPPRNDTAHDEFDPNIEVPELAVIGDNRIRIESPGGSYPACAVIVPSATAGTAAILQNIAERWSGPMNRTRGYVRFADNGTIFNSGNELTSLRLVP